MSSTRRDFVRHSATAAAALSLAPLEQAAASVTPADREQGKPGAARTMEAALLRARPVPLASVRVLGGPLKRAQEATATYLLSLDPDRMMAYYRIRAGLPQKAEPYDGWDGGGRNLTGHIAGHHLSAVSLMFLATGDPRFKSRGDYLVRELAEVQQKQGDGYLGAIEGGREAFAALSRGEIRSAAFDLNGLWSPWYTLHKTFAGLRDAYRHTGNRTALDVELRYAAWAEHVLAPLDDAQLARMLNTEHGGMNEVMADLYADTEDRRWLALSYRFEHHAFTEALKRHQDNLEGKHGNCQIPKLMGSAARYGYAGDMGDILAASFFWDRVTQHHSYVTGGHGLAEYFGAPDHLAARVDGRTCESCNVYNMLKLTRRLFSFRPDAAYADFHERALFNHALASIDPANGRTSYMVPVGRGVQQEYQDMQHSFTCCVGTGMENHALHGDGIYYESWDTVWVNLFVPSSARLPAGGVVLSMDTGFPDGDSATLTLTMPASRAFTLMLRRPVWAGDGFAVRVNGAAVPLPSLASLRPGSAGGRVVASQEARPQPSSFVALRRTWRNGDTVEVALPRTLRLEPTPDNPSVAALLWGPLVLAADLGPRREGRDGPDVAVPVLVAAGRPVEEWVRPAGDAAGDFTAAQVARVVAQPAAPADLAFAPFYRTQERTYGIYFDVVTPGEFDARVAGYDVERERARRLEAATVSLVHPGDEQGERDYTYRSEPVQRPVVRSAGRTGRGGDGWFSFALPVDPDAGMALVVTYLNEPGLPAASGNFRLMVEEVEVGRFEPDTARTGFFDATYRVPLEATRGKARATVRVQADAGGRIAPIFALRMVLTRDL
jgi:uncharacterized protein